MQPTVAPQEEGSHGKLNILDRIGDCTYEYHVLPCTLPFQHVSDTIVFPTSVCISVDIICTRISMGICI